MSHTPRTDAEFPYLPICKNGITRLREWARTLELEIVKLKALRDHNRKLNEKFHASKDAAIKSLQAENANLREELSKVKKLCEEAAQGCVKRGEQIGELNRENDRLTEELNKRSNSDDVIGSCNCLTKTPDIKFHEKGCKYRLIVERNQLKKSLNWAVGEISKNSCQHEETHRGGAIWTICDQCGKKWADDEGGFVPYEEPKELTEAFELLK